MAYYDPSKGSGDPLADLKRQMLEQYLRKVQMEQDPTLRRLDRDIQYGKEDTPDGEAHYGREGLAQQAQLASGLTQAASTIGGTAQTPFIPQTANRLQASSDLGAKQLDKSSQMFDPRIYAALGKTGKSPKTQEYSGSDGITKLGKFDESGTLIKHKDDPIIKYPDMEKLTKSIETSYTKAIKDVKDSAAFHRNLYNLVTKANADPENAAALDHAIIFQFAKALDPGSVVRESEFAQIMGIGSAWDTLVNRLKKMAVGTRLSTELRNKILDSVKTMNDGNDKIKSSIDAKFQGRASKYGIPWSEIAVQIPELGGGKPVAGGTSTSVPSGFPRNAVKAGEPDGFTVNSQDELDSLNADKGGGWK